MKAAVYHGIQDIRIEEVADPGPPGPRELLIGVRRAGICGTDVAEYVHGPVLFPGNGPHPVTGQALPVVMGHEFMGEVLAVGSEVAGFAVGDRVACGAGVSCHACRHCRAGRTNICERYYTLGLQAPGGLAERVLAPAEICHKVPRGCSDESAALAQPLAVAVHALDRSGAQAGDTLLVLGAGAMGTLLAAAATARGIHVIAADQDAYALARVARVAGAETIDMRQVSLADVVRDLTGGRGMPFVAEVSGHPALLAEGARLVERGGTYLLIGLQARPAPLDFHHVVSWEIVLQTTVAHVCARDLPAALEILTQHPEIEQHLLERVIPLDALVQEGILAMAEGRVNGKVLIAVGERAATGRGPVGRMPAERGGASPS